MIYEWQRVRRFIGGKWGHVTGWIWGKRWVRLDRRSFEWDEDWDIPSGCIRYRQYIYRIDDGGMLMRKDMFDPTETWQALCDVW